MITLFRRIRQKLIDSGSVSKYLLYAVGEILLVVIGILIALQINNWNEQNKQKEVSNQTIQNLKIELMDGKKNLEFIIGFNEVVLERSGAFIIEEYPLDSLKTNPGKIFNFTNYAPGIVDFPILESELSSERNIVGEEELNTLLRGIKDKNIQLKEVISYLDEFWNSQVSPYFIETKSSVSYYKNFSSLETEVPYSSIKELAEGDEYRNLVAMINLFTKGLNRNAESLIAAINEALLVIEEIN